MEGTYTGSVRCNVRCSEFIVYKDQGWGGEGASNGAAEGSGGSRGVESSGSRTGGGSGNGTGGANDLHIDGIQPYVQYRRLLSLVLLVRSLTDNPLLPSELFAFTKSEFQFLPLEGPMRRVERLLHCLEEGIASALDHSSSCLHCPHLLLLLLLFIFHLCPLLLFVLLVVFLLLLCPYFLQYDMSIQDPFRRDQEENIGQKTTAFLQKSIPLSFTSRPLGDKNVHAGGICEG